MSTEALLEAIEVAKGQSKLARAVAELSGKPCTQAHVWNWLNRDERTPPEFAPYIEKVTGVSRERLCPDFPWGPVP